MTGRPIRPARSRMPADPTLMHERHRLERDYRAAVTDVSAGRDREEALVRALDVICAKAKAYTGVDTPAALTAALEEIKSVGESVLDGYGIAANHGNDVNAPEQVAVSATEFAQLRYVAQLIIEYEPGTQGPTLEYIKGAAQLVDKVRV